MKTFNVILLFGFLLFGMTAQAQKSVPDVSVKDADGNAISLSEAISDGQPKLVSLWATWCGPCRMELNALKDVYQDWKTKYNVEILAITTDVGPMVDRAKAMFDKNGWTYTFLHDHDQSLMKAMNVKSIPYSFLVDGQGNIISEQTGYYPGYEKAIEAKLKSL